MEETIVETGMELISLKQLPVIEERLISVKSLVEDRIRSATVLDCTEENYKEIKKIRSELNKEKADLESRRKYIKSSILAPYEQFEKTYKDCVGNLYDEADRVLAEKIRYVEDEIKRRKEEAIRIWFDEYRQSVGLTDEYATFERSGIKIGMSSTMKSLQEAGKSFIDKVASDLLMIETQEHADEILVEYKKSLSVQDAVVMVSSRHKAIEESQRRREEQAEMNRRAEEAAQKVQQIVEAEKPSEAPISAPVVEPVVVPVEAQGERIIKATFTVTAPLSKMKELKKFLDEGGYYYE